MPELDAPWALSGLLLVPLIRWLHLYNSRKPTRLVSALFLWRDHGPTSEPGRRGSRPDSAWRRRAWIAALLVLALAGPRWSDSRPRPIPVLFDDAPSMHTLEADRARREHAVELLLEAAERDATAALELRPLRGDKSILRLNADSRADWRRRILEWLPEPASGPPRPAPERDYWLISDGADQTLVERLRAHPPSRTILVGRETENLALSRLAVRPSLTEPERFAGIVEVYNAGHNKTGVQVEVRGLHGVALNRALEVVPGGKTQLQFTLPAATPWLRAIIRGSSQALTLDDRLELDLTALKRRIGVHAAKNCGGERLRAGLSSHPRLNIAVNPRNADILIICHATATATTIPVLWFSDPSAATAPLKGPVYWTREAGQLQQLDLNAVDLFAGPVPDPIKGTILLTGSERPLILLQEGPPTLLRVLLDLEATATALDYQFPVLLVGLLDLLLGRELLGVHETTGRDLSEAHIAPGRLEGLAYSSGRFSTVGSARDLSPFLLWTAVALVLADMLLTVRDGSVRRIESNL